MKTQYYKQTPISEVKLEELELGRNYSIITHEFGHKFWAYLCNETGEYFFRDRDFSFKIDEVSDILLPVSPIKEEIKNGDYALGHDNIVILCTENNRMSIQEHWTKIELSNEILSSISSANLPCGSDGEVIDEELDIISTKYANKHEGANANFHSLQMAFEDGFKFSHSCSKQIDGKEAIEKECEHCKQTMQRCFVDVCNNDECNK